MTLKKSSNLIIRIHEISNICEAKSKKKRASISILYRYDRIWSSIECLLRGNKYDSDDGLLVHIVIGDHQAIANVSALVQYLIALQRKLPEASSQ